MWRFITSNEFLGAAGFLLAFLVGAITLSVKHFRRLQLIKGLLLRVPVALYDCMILDAAAGPSDALAAIRSTTRFSCRETLRSEDYNNQLDAFADEYQHACLYPLKSTASLVAAVLSLFILVVLGVYLAGKNDPDATTALPSASTNAIVQAVASNVPTPATIGATPTTSRRDNFDAHADAWRHAVLEALPAAGILVAVVVSLFFVCFVACFHFGVHDNLVNDVIKLCDTVGVIALKSDPSGRRQMGHLVAADDDADYKALMRLIGKSA